MRKHSYNKAVDQDTAQRLVDLNRQFYQTFAASFSATRRRLQPGVWRLLEQVAPEARILDLGCGNGELFRALKQRGFTGFYLGVDFSPGLLADAQADSAGSFQAFDLANPDWSPIYAHAPFDLAAAFAVLHHLPGETLRIQTLLRLRDVLPMGGLFFHSQWQFLNSARLRLRIQPWEKAGISADRVDAGDYLLDWRAESGAVSENTQNSAPYISAGPALRYVHHFTPDELGSLAAAAGFSILETFHSDGEGGRLSVYQVWKVT